MRTDSEHIKKYDQKYDHFLSQLCIFRSISPTFGENRLYPKNTKIPENRGFEWCRRTDLNCGPHPYQGCALPLSYGGIFLRSGQCHFKTQLAICYLDWDLYKQIKGGAPNAKKFYFKGKTNGLSIKGKNGSSGRFSTREPSKAQITGACASKI